MRLSQTRRTRLIGTILLGLIVAWATPGIGQTGSAVRQERARSPYSITPPPRFQRAIERGTRTTTGQPGPQYWQQYARYCIDARVDTDGRRLEGRSRTIYFNNSPDSLAYLMVKLYLNLHAEGVMRNAPVEVTGGVHLSHVSVDGEAADVSEEPADRGVERAPSYDVNGTTMEIWPRRPLAPRDSVALEFEWSFDVPQRGALGRMGWSGDNILFVGYWYPQMAVYDDVVGWHADPFLGRAEFYNGFADYDIQIDAPEGWLVLGTGELINREEVLAPPILERLRKAEQSNEVVHVVSADDLNAGRVTVPTETGRLVWHLRATQVRDVAFSVTRQSVWDAARIPVGDRDSDDSGDYTRIDALYRASSARWTEMVRYGQYSIAFFSEYLDFPYPWPHMTAVEGGDFVGGGMEYPMMTRMGPLNGPPAFSLYSLALHELGHSWFPMIVNSDEVRWAWMDEGLTV